MTQQPLFLPSCLEEDRVPFPKLPESIVPEFQMKNIAFARQQVVVAH